MTKKPSATIEAWIARDLPDGMGLVDPTHDADGIERSLHPELAVVRETAEQARTSRVPPGVPLVLIDAVSQREVPFATSAIRELREMNRAEIDAESRAYKTWLDTIPGARLLVTQGGARGLWLFQGVTDS